MKCLTYIGAWEDTRLTAKTPPRILYLVVEPDYDVLCAPVQANGIFTSVIQYVLGSHTHIRRAMITSMRSQGTDNFIRRIQLNPATPDERLFTIPTMLIKKDVYHDKLPPTIAV
jgi:hypothetical protein